MKVSKERALANREALVVSARQLFREHGFAAVSVAAIAERAGLTTGAFYSHFGSKREIEVLAISSMIEKAASDWREVVQQNPATPLKSLVEGYLGHDHLGAGDVGCAFAALGAELGRAEQEVRTAAAAALPSQIEVLQSLFVGDSAEERERKALAAYASLVGAATMIRGLEDESLGQRISLATATMVLSLR